MPLPVNELLHLGPDPAGAGWNHFDLGLGLSSHINYPQAQLKNSPPQGQPWFYSKTNTTSGKDVGVFSAPFGGATTSTNTQYARCELREYERDGTTKAAWDPKDGDHWVEGIYRIYGLSGLDKPGVCVQQAHDPDDDVLMIRTELVSGQIRLQLRYNGSLVATLNSNYVDGTEFYLKSRLINGTPEVYYTTNLASIPTTPTHTSSGYFSSASSGWYFKTGSYNQTNESTDPDKDQDASIIRVEVRELKHWHSKTPKGGAWPTPATYAAAGGGTPVPEAGANATIAQTGTFSRTGTVTLNGATLNSQQWRIFDGPTGDGTVLSSTSSVSFNPSGRGLPAGTYILEYSVNTSAGTFTDTVTVTVTSVVTPVDTTTAAGVKGWGKPIKVDEFNRTGAPGSDWGVYNGPGHAGNGTRDPARVTVDGSKLVGTGLANGASFGMNHRFYQQYGKWEVRMRAFETGTVIEGNRYHVVLIVWPESGRWPEDGEYDFVELSIPGQNSLVAFMHFPHDADQSVQQRQFTKTGVDTSQWHNYAFEWTPNELVGYVDGVEWFRTSGGASSIRRNIQDMPSGGLTIQLDNFDGTNQTPATMEVDWVKVYPLVPIPDDTVPDPGTPGSGTSTGTYPGFGAKGTANVQSDGTNAVAVAPPPGVQPSNFQICVIECATSAESITSVPSGWRLLDEQAITSTAGGDSGDSSMTWIYYNTTGDNVSRTWTKSGERGFHAVRMFWTNTSGLTAHSVRASSSTLTPYGTPVTPTTDRAIAVAVLTSDRLNTRSGPISVPTGWTERYNADPSINTTGVEYEAIAVAEIQVANKAVAGANVPTGTGLGTSNFELTNADACQVFTFVLEGPISTGTVYAGSLSLPIQPKITINHTLAPIPVGGLLLRVFPQLSVRTILSAAIRMWASGRLTLDTQLFPRGAFIIVPSLTFISRQQHFAGVRLEAIAALRAMILPYRRPVLRTEYQYPPEDHPFRLIAQRVLDGEIIEWELPVDEDFEYVEQLSGPTVMTGKFEPEMIQVQELGLDGYAYWLHVEINQEIRASALLLPLQYEESSMSFSAEGPSALPHYHIYDAIYRQIQTDPLSVVRTLWNYVQSQPDSDLGVIVSNNSSPVRIGEPATVEIIENEDGTTTTRPVEAKPYELLWWDATNIGQEIDTLADQTPFDYVERNHWNADRTDVLHYVDLGYPRLGVARPELLFNEENILEVVPVQELEDTYASAVLVIGAGDGEDTIRGYAAQSYGDRVRKMVTVTDKTIKTKERANARALSELAFRRGRTFEASEIVIDAYHTNAPIGSYRVGDDIQVQIEIPWLMEIHEAWYRITSISNKPSSNKIRLGIARSDTLLDTSVIWVQPDDYVPFTPPPPVGAVGYSGNVHLAIVARLVAIPPVPVPTANVVLIITPVLTPAGTLYGGSFAFVNNLFAVPELTIASPRQTLIALVSMPLTATLVASGIATGAGFSTVTLISTAALSAATSNLVSASATLNAVAALTALARGTFLSSATLPATPALSVGGVVTKSGAVSLGAAATLSANGTVTSGTTVTQLGKTDNGASQSSSSGDKTVVSKVTASVAGTITAGHARMWVDSGTAVVRMCVYSDSGGLPGSLLGISDNLTLSNTAEALKDFTFSGAQRPDVSVSTDYWIGFTWADPGTNNIFWSRGGTASQAQQNNLNGASSFGTPGTVLTGPIDAYVDVVTTAPSGTEAPDIVRSGNGFSATATVAANLGGAANSGNLLLWICAADKNPGTLTMSGSGWSTPVNLRSTSVSLVMAWKVASGGENSLSGTFNSAPATGNRCWVAELSQSGTGAWTVISASNNSDESTITSTGSGTTAAATVEKALALAAWAIDSVLNAGTSFEYTNSFSELLTPQSTLNGSGDGGEAGLWVATKEIDSGQTASSTLSQTGASNDQMSGGIIVVGRA